MNYFRKKLFLSLSVLVAIVALSISSKSIAENGFGLNDESNSRLRVLVEFISYSMEANIEGAPTCYADKLSADLNSELGQSILSAAISEQNAKGLNIKNATELSTQALVHIPGSELSLFTGKELGSCLEKASQL